MKVIAAFRNDCLCAVCFRVASYDFFALSVIRQEEFGFPQPVYEIGSGKPRAKARGFEVVTGDRRHFGRTPRVESSFRFLIDQGSSGL
jgi:hypothetical protein